MKQLGKTTFFWSSLAALNSLFIVVFLWAVIPFGGETLPHLLEQVWDIPFTFSAMLVSLLCALVAVGATFIMALHPAAILAVEVERQGSQSGKK